MKIGWNLGHFMISDCDIIFLKLPWVKLHILEERTLNQNDIGNNNRNWIHIHKKYDQTPNSNMSII